MGYVQCSQASSQSIFGSGRGGRQHLKGGPGRISILASVRTAAGDGQAGTAGASGGVVCWVTRDDGRAQRVIDGPTGNWRGLQKTVKTAEDE